MSKIQVLIAGKLLSDAQTQAIAITVHQAFLKLHYWMHGEITPATPDFAPTAETLEHYLRHIEMLDLLKPEYFAGCFKTHPAPFTLVDGVATSKFTIEEIVVSYNQKWAAAQAAHQETYHR